MTLPDPQPGLVIRYAYLWRHERAQGREEASKDRPCAVVLAVRRGKSRIVVAVAPITHAPPHDPQNALQLPLTTKFRLGLDDQMSWIVLDDLNYFTWPGHDLRPADPRDPSKGIAFGYLPAAITSRIIGRVRDLMRAGRAKLTDRD